MVVNAAGKPIGINPEYYPVGAPAGVKAADPLATPPKPETPKPVDGTPQAAPKDGNQAAQYAEGGFDPQSGVKLEKNRPPQAEIEAAVKDYEAAVAEFEALPVEQRSPEALAKLQQSEAKLAALVTRFTEYLESHPDAHDEVKTLGDLMKQIAPTRQKANGMREVLQMQAMQALPDPKASKYDGSLAVALPALEAGLANPKKEVVPKGIDAKYYHLGRAMAQNNISLAELRHFALTGEMSENMQKTLNRAQETGSWTALNASQGMIDTRMAVLRAESNKLTGELDKLRASRAAASDPAEQGKLDEQIKGLEQAIAETNASVDGLKKLKTKTINNASTMRINTAQRNLHGAAMLEQQAAKYKESNPKKYQSLMDQAGKIRALAIKALEAEGASLAKSADAYKAKGKEPPVWLKKQAGEAYDGAAQGHMADGQTAINAMDPAKPLMPASLEKGQGADAALKKAEDVNPDLKQDLDHQALKSQYHGMRRTVYDKQVKASGYDKAIAEGQAPSPAGMAARKAYLGESQDLLGTVETRIGLLEQKGPLTKQQTQELGQLQHTAGSIHREFAQASNHYTQAQLIQQQSGAQLSELKKEQSQLELETKALATAVEGLEAMKKNQSAGTVMEAAAAAALESKSKELAEKRARLAELNGKDGKPGLVAQTEQTFKVSSAAIETYKQESMAANGGKLDQNATLKQVKAADAYYDKADANYSSLLSVKVDPKDKKALAAQIELQKEAAAFKLDKASYQAEAQDMLTTEGLFVEHLTREQGFLSEKQKFFAGLPKGASTIAEAVGDLKSQKEKLAQESKDLYETMAMDPHDRPNFALLDRIEKLGKQQAELQKQIDALEKMPDSYKQTSKQEVDAKLAAMGAPDSKLGAVAARGDTYAPLFDKGKRADKAVTAIDEARALRKGLPPPKTEAEKQELRSLQTQEVLASGAVAGTFATVRPNQAIKLLSEGRKLVQQEVRPQLAADLKGLEAELAKTQDPAKAAALKKQIEELRLHPDHLSSSLASASQRTMGELYANLKVGVGTGAFDGAHIDQAFKLLEGLSGDIQAADIKAPHKAEVDRVKRQFAALLVIGDTAAAQLKAGNEVFNQELDKLYEVVKQSNDAAISDIIDLGSELVFWGDSMEDQMNAATKEQYDNARRKDDKAVRNFERGASLFKQGMIEAVRSGRGFEYLGLVMAGQNGWGGPKQSEIETRLNRDFLAGARLPVKPPVQVFGQSLSYDQLDGVDQNSKADFILGGKSGLTGIMVLHPGLAAMRKSKSFEVEAYAKAMGDAKQPVLTSDAEGALEVYGQAAQEWAKEAQKLAIINTVLETALFIVVPIPLGSVRSLANGARTARALSALSKLPGLGRAINGASQLGKIAAESRTLIRLGEGLAALQKARPVLYSFGRGALQMGALSGTTMLAEKYATQAWGVDSKLTKLIRVGGNMLDIGAASKIARFKDFIPKLAMAEGMVAVNLFAVPAAIKDPDQAAFASWLIGAVVPAAIGAHSLRSQAHAQAGEISRQILPDGVSNEKLRFGLEHEMAVFADQNANKPATQAEFKAHSERLGKLMEEHGVPTDKVKGVVELQRAQWAYASAQHGSKLPEFTQKNLPTPEHATKLVDSTAKALIDSGLEPQLAWQRAGEIVARNFEGQAAHLRRDGKPGDEPLAAAYEQVMVSAMAHGEGGHWTHALKDIPDGIKADVQKAIAETRQTEVKDPKAHIEAFRQKLAGIEAGGKKLGDAEINTLVLVESHRLITDATRLRAAEFAAQGIPVSEAGMERMMQAEAQKLGLSEADAKSFVDTMLGRTPEVKAERAATADKALSTLKEQADFFEQVAKGYGIAFENPELVMGKIREAYDKGLALSPEVFGMNGIKADPRHQAFIEKLPELLARIDAKPIEGQAKPIDGWKGVASDTERLATPNGDVFFKAFGGQNGNKPRGEVLASMANEMMGLDLIPKTRFVTHEGKLGSASDAIPEGFTQGQHVSRKSLREDALYRDGLSDLRAFDYIIAAADRHPGNLFIDTKTGKVMAIDNDSALSTAIPFSERPRTDSGGILPDHYTARMREAVAKMTPEAIQKQFKGLASPAEIDAMILRVEIVKADILKKHGPDALSIKEGPAKPVTPDAVMGDHYTPIPPGTSTANRPIGPEPLLRVEDPIAVSDARRKLAEGKPFTPADSKAFLSDVAVTARDAMLHGKQGYGDKVFNAENLCGYCGFGQAATFYRLTEMGIPPEKIHLIQNAVTFGKDANSHAYLVVEMPDGKSYLVDTTLRQFFDKQGHPDGPGKTGAMLRATPEGRAIADTLLRDGFIELTDQVASIYGNAMRRGKPGPPIIKSDYHKTTGFLDFRRDEMPQMPKPDPVGGPDSVTGGKSSNAGFTAPPGFEPGRVVYDRDGKMWRVESNLPGLITLKNQAGKDKMIMSQADLADFRNTQPLPKGFTEFGLVRDAGGGIWKLRSEPGGRVALQQGSTIKQMNPSELSANYKPVDSSQIKPVESKAPKGLGFETDAALAKRLGIPEKTRVEVLGITPEGQYRLRYLQGDQVREQLAAPALLKQVLPSADAKAFSAKFPLSEGDGYPRAFVALDADDPRDAWRVTGYDAETGLATVQKTHVEIVNPVKPQDNPRFANHHAFDFKKGELVTDNQGIMWRVKDQTDSLGSKSVLLERVEVQQVRGADLLTLTPEIHKHFQPEGLGKLIDPIKKVFDAGPKIEKVGAERVGTPKDTGVQKVKFENAEKSPEVDARVYEVEIALKDGRKHKVKIAVPEGEHSKQQIDLVKQALAELPIKQIDALDLIRVNPDKQANKDDDHFASAQRNAERKGIMDFYPSALGKDGSDGYHRFDIAWHELGHLIASKLFSAGDGAKPEAIPGKTWDAAMSGDVDRNHKAGKHGFVSDYAKKNIKEDFAETVMLYLATDGGRSDLPPYMADRLKLKSGTEIREQFKERFLVLDKYFEAHPGELAGWRKDGPDIMKGMAMGIGALGIAGKYVWRMAEEEEEER